MAPIDDTMVRFSLHEITCNIQSSKGQRIHGAGDLSFVHEDSLVSDSEQDSPGESHDTLEEIGDTIDEEERDADVSAKDNKKQLNSRKRMKNLEGSRQNRRRKEEN